MAVYKKQEFMDALKALVGDKNDDDTLAVIQNFSETYDSFTSEENEDWKSKYDELKTESDNKYKELDTNWRNKYRDTFFTGNKDKDFETAVQKKDEEQAEESGQGITIEDLFADK